MTIMPDLRGGMNTYSGIIWHIGKEGPEVYWSMVGQEQPFICCICQWDGYKAEFGRMFEYKPEPMLKWPCQMKY